MALGVARTADGRLEMFPPRADLAVWHDWQTVQTASGQGWEPVARETDNEAAVGLNAAGDLQLFPVNDQGNRWPGLRSTGWTGGINLGGHAVGGGLTGAPAAEDGRLELFVRARDGSVLHNWRRRRPRRTEEDGSHREPYRAT